MARCGRSTWTAAFDEPTAFATLGKKQQLPEGEGVRLEVQLIPSWPWWLGQFGITVMHTLGLLIVVWFSFMGLPNRSKAALAAMLMVSSSISIAVIVAMSVQGADQFCKSFVWWCYTLSLLLLMVSRIHRLSSSRPPRWYSAAEHNQLHHVLCVTRVSPLFPLSILWALREPLQLQLQESVG